MSKNWRDLEAGRKAAIVMAGAIQFGLMAALVDIYRRTAEDIQGGKPYWVAASFVNYIGPLAYFLFGRGR